MDPFLLAAVIFLAVMVQSLTGFGSALVAMSLLAAPLGIRTATPLVALVALIAEIALAYRFRKALKWAILRRLIVASLIGIPVGAFALRIVDERLLLTILGIVVIGYALYALLGLKLPTLQQPIWAYGLGFLAGILGGAYNTSGPPVILYADCQRWPREQFKGNLQGFFLMNGILIVLGHALVGNFNAYVLESLSVSLIPIGLGLWAGLALDKRLSADTFRKIVLAALVVLGLGMLF